MGRAGAVVANANEANARLAKLAAMGGPVAFIAKIHYAFIPNAVVTGEDYFTGTTRTPASGKTFPERAGLQGFEFFFDNKDHHILDLGVMPPLAGGIVRTWPSLPARPDEAIAFQDSNRNDPIKWAVKFVTLR